MLSGLYTPRYEQLQFFYNDTCRFLASRPVFDDNMFGDKDFIGIPLISSYTIDQQLTTQITHDTMDYRWTAGLIAIYLVCAPLCSQYSVVNNMLFLLSCAYTIFRVSVVGLCGRSREVHSRWLSC
jgi:hypothetical protein